MDATQCALIGAVFCCPNVECRPGFCIGEVWQRSCSTVHTALLLTSPLPQRRLRGKTPLAWVANGQVPLPAPLELLDEAKPDARRQAYLVTFPFPKQPRSATGEVLVASSSMPKSEVVKKLLDALSRPEVVHHLQSPKSIPVIRVGCWREFHTSLAAGSKDTHDHVALLASETFRFKGVKLALLHRYGLASHWSCSHDGYWSCSPRPPNRQPVLIGIHSSGMLRGHILRSRIVGRNQSPRKQCMQSARSC